VGSVIAVTATVTLEEGGMFGLGSVFARAAVAELEVRGKPTGI
jgi:hypothetical protein